MTNRKPEARDTQDVEAARFQPQEAVEVNPEQSYAEYRHNTELAAKFFLEAFSPRRLRTDLTSLWFSFRGLLHAPRLSPGSIVRLVISLAIGLALALWVIGRENVISSIGRFVLFSVAYALIALWLMWEIPRFIRALRSRRLWLYTAACFLVFFVPVLITILDELRVRTLSPTAVAQEVGTAVVSVILLALAVAWWIDKHAVPLSRRLVVALAVFSILFGILLGAGLVVAIAFLQKAAGIDIVAFWDNLPGSTWAAIGLLCVTFAFLGEWRFYTWIRQSAAPGVVRARSWLRTQATLAIDTVKKTESFLVITLNINRLYVTGWVFWLPFAALALLAPLVPDAGRMACAAVGLWLGLIVLVLWLSVTLQYIFIPQELLSVRVKLPRYIARPLVRGAVVLALLFIAWWMYHSVLMLTAENFYSAENTTGYAFLDQARVHPQLGDFVYYAFSLMTNAPYVELQAAQTYTRLYTMFVTLTGLLLLVGFVGVAMSSRDETAKSEAPDTGTSPVNPSSQSPAQAKPRAGLQRTKKLKRSR